MLDKYSITPYFGCNYRIRSSTGVLRRKHGASTLRRASVVDAASRLCQWDNSGAGVGLGAGCPVIARTIFEGSPTVLSRTTLCKKSSTRGGGKAGPWCALAGPLEDAAIDDRCQGASHSEHRVDKHIPLGSLSHCYDVAEQAGRALDGGEMGLHLGLCSVREHYELHPPNYGSSAHDMDKASIGHGWADGPALVQANWYQFSSGQRVRHDLVVSFAWVWCVRGLGTIRSDGSPYHLTTGSLIRLPWRHDVQYNADRRDPFLLGAVHILPRHERGVVIDRRASHGSEDPLGSAVHRDAPDASEHDVWRRGAGVFVFADRAIDLGTLAVRVFESAAPSDDELRALGELIVAESLRLDRVDVDIRRPANLRAIKAYILEHLGSSLTFEAISREGGCSRATIERLFSKHEGLSVQAWIRDRRMEAAADMLRTTGLRVNEVARRVGFSDPLYFSRVFRPMPLS